MNVYTARRVHGPNMGLGFSAQYRVALYCTARVRRVFVCIWSEYVRVYGPNMGSGFSVLYAYIVYRTPSPNKEKNNSYRHMNTNSRIFTAQYSVPIPHAVRARALRRHGDLQVSEVKLEVTPGCTNLFG